MRVCVRVCVCVCVCVCVGTCDAYKCFWQSRRLMVKVTHSHTQGWALSVFLNFFNNKKLFFAFFIKIIRLGVGFLNGTGAEIGY